MVRALSLLDLTRSSPGRRLLFPNAYIYAGQHVCFHELILLALPIFFVVSKHSTINMRLHRQWSSKDAHQRLGDWLASMRIPVLEPCVVINRFGPLDQQSFFYYTRWVRLSLLTGMEKGHCMSEPGQQPLQTWFRFRPHPSQYLRRRVVFRKRTFALWFCPECFFNSASILHAAMSQIYILRYTRGVTMLLKARETTRMARN